MVVFPSPFQNLQIIPKSDVLNSSKLKFQIAPFVKASSHCPVGMEITAQGFLPLLQDATAGSPQKPGILEKPGREDKELG